MLFKRILLGQVQSQAILYACLSHAVLHTKLGPRVVSRDAQRVSSCRAARLHALGGLSIHQVGQPPLSTSHQGTVGILLFLLKCPP